MWQVSFVGSKLDANMLRSFASESLLTRSFDSSISRLISFGVTWARLNASG